MGTGTRADRQNKYAINNRPARGQAERLHHRVHAGGRVVDEDEVVSVRAHECGDIVMQ